MGGDEIGNSSQWQKLPDATAAQRTGASRPEIVYLDPNAERPVSQYSPEGEIRMMGDFAAGLSRHRRVSRPMAYGLVLIVLLPILISALALLASLWWPS